MLSRSVVVWCLLVVLPLARGQYEPPKPRVIFYHPRGFEISIPDEPGITLFAFHAKKNVLLDGREAGTWNENVHKKTNGRFVFVDPDTKFNLGDRLNYWIFVEHNGLGYESLNLMEEVRSKFSKSVQIYSRY